MNGGPVAIWPLVVAILVIVLAFEVWMFIDALQNPELTPQSRLLWLAGMVLLHPFVAIAYFFMARRHDA